MLPQLENVVMVRDSEGTLVPKLIDFEHSVLVHPDGSPCKCEKHVAGTRAYFSPERYWDAEEEQQRLLEGNLNYDRKVCSSS